MREMRNRLHSIFSLAALIVLAACAPTAAAPPPATPVPARPTLSGAAPSPTASARPHSTLPEPSPTPAEQNYTPICSPLEGESLADLTSPDLLKNPFQPPRPGDDGGHFGVDFAYWTAADGSAMLGLPVRAALDATIAAVVEERMPYGNMLILETSIEQLPPAWRAALPFQGYDLSAPLQPPLSLTCPDYDFTPPSGALSIYTLYAHLQNRPAFRVGDSVACGEEIGRVGSTGKSVNAHLHFESRIGPSGVTFSSLAHYDTSASVEEMRNYCLWRLSGAFQAFDPLLLLELPAAP